MARDEYEIETETMECAKGMWAGIRPQWWTVTHKKTGFQIRVHDMNDMPPYKMREYIEQVMDMIIQDMNPVGDVR